MPYRRGRRITTGAAIVAALLLAGCGHKGEHCVRSQPVTTYIFVGKVLVPTTQIQCVVWEKDRP